MSVFLRAKTKMYVCLRQGDSVDLGRSAVKIYENREQPFTGDQLRVRREHRINEPIPYTKGYPGNYIVVTPLPSRKREILSFAHMTDDVSFIRVKPGEFSGFRRAMRRIAGSSFGEIYAAIGAPGVAFKFLKPNGFEDSTVMDEFNPRIDPEREIEAPGEFSRKRSDEDTESSEGSISLSSNSSGEGSTEPPVNPRRRVKVINLSKIKGRDDDDEENEKAEKDLSRGYNWGINTYIPIEVFNWLAITAAGDPIIKTGYGDIYCKKYINIIRTQNEPLHDPYINVGYYYREFPFKHWSAFYISPRGGVYIKNTLMDSNLADILEGKLNSAAQFQMWQMLFHKNNPQAPANVLDVQIQMAAAIHFLHANNTVHFDLKPEQFLVRVANELSGRSTIEVRLTDFGTCVIFDNALLTPFIKQGFTLKCMYDTGDVRGNYIYTAPEYLTGHRIAHYPDDKEKCGKDAPADMKAIDIWGLGVMFYQFKYEGAPMPHMKFIVETDADWIEKSVQKGYLDKNEKRETKHVASILRAIVAYFGPIPDDLIESEAYLPRALKAGESLRSFPLANFVKTKLDEDTMDEYLRQKAFSPKTTGGFLDRIIKYNPETRMSAHDIVQFLVAEKMSF